VAAQCGHATLGAYKRSVKRNAEAVKAWSIAGQTKIAVKCPDENELHAIEKRATEMGLISYLVADAGRTQIEAGTETVLAIGKHVPFGLDYITLSK
jgi:peptidyl-tRNA hydrolase